MIFHFFGLLTTFLLSAWASAGITLVPISVAWSNIWVYITFGLMLVPGYVIAWLGVMLFIFLLAALGIGAAAGGAAALDRFSKPKRRF